MMSSCFRIYYFLLVSHGTRSIVDHLQLRWTLLSLHATFGDNIRVSGSANFSQSPVKSSESHPRSAIRCHFWWATTDSGVRRKRCSSSRVFCVCHSIRDWTIYSGPQCELELCPLNRSSFFSYPLSCTLLNNHDMLWTWSFSFCFCSDATRLTETYASESPSLCRKISTFLRNSTCTFTTTSDHSSITFRDESSVNITSLIRIGLDNAYTKDIGLHKMRPCDGIAQFRARTSRDYSLLILHGTSQETVICPKICAAGSWRSWDSLLVQVRME